MNAQRIEGRCPACLTKAELLLLTAGFDLRCQTGCDEDAVLEAATELARRQQSDPAPLDDELGELVTAVLKATHPNKRHRLGGIPL